MVLVKDLVNFLNEEEEPLEKRLKIAHYAFSSPNLYSSAKETYLLDWITNITNNVDAWKLFNQWLHSEHFKRLNKTDLSQECIKKIYKVVVEKLRSEDHVKRRIAVNSSLEIINNPTFHEYFKLNLKNYFNFLCTLVKTIDDKEQILNFLNNNNIFHKIYRTTDKFYKYFFELLLPEINEINLKYGDNQIFQEICLFTQKYVLHKNFKLFDNSLQQFFEENIIAEHPILEHFLRSLLSIYSTSAESCASFTHIFFNAICNEYCNSPVFVYKLSAVLFQNLGFKLAEILALHCNDKEIDYRFDKSLTVVVTVFQTLTIFKNELNLKINEIEFSGLIEMLISSIINITGVPNDKALKIIYYCIDIDPLIIDKMISEILEYLLIKNNCCKIEYIQLFNLIFKVFAKLHRIQNLISKMLPVFKQQLGNTLTSKPNQIQFNGTIDQQNVTYEYDIENIFPKEVLNSFVDCVGNLASWQVINLFKTFLFHLGSSIEHDLQAKSNLIYIEVTGVFLCQFLSSVRIAEHTVPDFAINKFVKAMEELKIILNKFGNILITMEHDHILMRTFLSICCSWGDLYMILSYYSSSVDILLTEIRNQDHFLANISYIHPYLTAVQWSLISERVNNFGKAQCKRLMQNLYTQHIKAVLLFENKLNEDMIITLINNFMLSLDDLWPCIVDDSFILNNIVPKMHSSHILALAEVVIKNLFEQADIAIFAKTLHSEVMLKYLVYNILLRINKILKPKKTAESLPMSTKIFNEFQETFSEGNENTCLFNKLLNIFNEELIQNEVGLKVNKEKLSQHLKILSKIPVIMTADFRLCTALYLLAILSDLRSIDKNDSENTEHLETLLTGILQIATKPLAISLTPENAIHYLVENVTNYKKIFNYFIESLFVQNNYVALIEDLSKCLLINIGNDKKYEECLSMLLWSMMKQRKRKICSEYKNNLTLTIQKISEKLTELISSEKIVSVSLYTTTLKISLACNEQNVKELKKYLNNYTEIALNRTTEKSSYEEAVLLLSTILHNTPKFDIVNDNFLLKIWETYKTVEMLEENIEEKRKLIVLIFEHITNDNFAFITNDLLKNTIHQTNGNAFMNYINIWTSILSCNFNQIKSVIWLQMLQSLLQKLLLRAKEYNVNIQQEIIEFEIQLTQTIHISLTSSILDTMFLTLSHCISEDVIDLCTKLLDVLLRYRKALITDRLPSFLQLYRTLLQELCKISNSIVHIHQTQNLEKSAHNLEMLTKNLVCYGKHMSRLTPYLIADILTQFERVNLIPEVKMHLENCIYSLLQLCDQHAISFIMRTLSIPSTEIFKFIYENYTKFYRYKGKV